MRTLLLVCLTFLFVEGGASQEKARKERPKRDEKRSIEADAKHQSALISERFALDEKVLMANKKFVETQGHSAISAFEFGKDITITRKSRIALASKSDVAVLLFPTKLTTAKLNYWSKGRKTWERDIDFSATGYDMANAELSVVLSENGRRAAVYC